MTDELRLDGEDWEQQLTGSLAAMPIEQAPPGLRRKLRRIPRQQRALERPGLFLPRWAIALSLVPVLLASFLYWDNSNKAREIAQGRRDLAVALVYLEKINREANAQLMAAIEDGLARPVTNQTTQALQRPLEIQREYEL